jgi:hypothetical protein
MQVVKYREAEVKTKEYTEECGGKIQFGISA